MRSVRVGAKKKGTEKRERTSLTAEQIFLRILSPRSMSYTCSLAGRGGLSSSLLRLVLTRHLVYTAGKHTVVTRA